MTALAHLAPRRTRERRPTTAGMILDQVGYAVREISRTRIVLVFTFLLPLAWLVMIGMLIGNEAADATTGVRVMQYVTPTAAVLGVLFGAFSPVATSLALAREQKLTKRLRGTPVPPWAYLLGRVGAAGVLATAAVTILLALGVMAYDVQIQWHTVLASLVTVLVGVGCLAALGLAVGALAPSAAVAETFSLGAVMILSFLSGLFTAGDAPPAWMASLGSFFPVRQLLLPLQDQFDPFKSGDGWNLGALAVLAAWGVVGVAVAAWALGREPKASGTPVAARPAPVASHGLHVAAPGRPTALALVLDQTRWANIGARRNISLIAFAVAMPVGVYVLMGAQWGNQAGLVAGVPFVLYFAAAMAAYGASVTAFVNRPSVMARARDAGHLKRLRGTPVTAAQYLAGQTLSALWIAIVTAILVFACGIAFFNVTLAPDGLPLGLAVLLFGTVSLAACGYALAALAPSGKAAGVVALGVLLVLSFISGVLVVGDIPAWMTAVGSFFPLRHIVLALAAALDPAGSSVAWRNLAVIAVWLVVASLIAVGRFRWEPSGPAQPISGISGWRDRARDREAGAGRRRRLPPVLPAIPDIGTATLDTDETATIDARRALEVGRLRKQRRFKLQLLVFAAVAVLLVTSGAPLVVGGQNLTSQVWPLLVVVMGIWLIAILVNGYSVYRRKV